LSRKFLFVPARFSSYIGVQNGRKQGHRLESNDEMMRKIARALKIILICNEASGAQDEIDRQCE
jgi:hypothetical protein